MCPCFVVLLVLFVFWGSVKFFLGLVSCVYRAFCIESAAYCSGPRHPRRVCFFLPGSVFSLVSLGRVVGSCGICLFGGSFVQAAVFSCGLFRFLFFSFRKGDLIVVEFSVVVFFWGFVFFCFFLFSFFFFSFGVFFLFVFFFFSCVGGFLLLVLCMVCGIMLSAEGRGG